MKLKDIIGKITKNNSNGQLTACFKKKKLKELGIDEIDLLNIKLKKKW